MASRGRALLVLLAGIAVAAVPAGAAPPTAASPAGAPTVRLLSPVEATPLVAGGSATLAWEPLAGFAELRDVEEWEAFLSLDGGASYPIRLTPHLDADVRRVSWRVPAVATDDARLLLRFGDERRETAVALPARLVIVPPTVASPLGDEALTFARRSTSLAGEEALPGQRGVVAWVDGSRRGGGLRQLVGAGWRLVAPAESLPANAPSTEIEDGEIDPPETALELLGAAAPRPPAGASRDVGSAPPRPCPDILLLGQRQNE